MRALRMSHCLTCFTTLPCTCRWPFPFVVVVWLGSLFGLFAFVWLFCFPLVLQVQGVFISLFSRVLDDRQCFTARSARHKKKHRGATSGRAHGLWLRQQHTRALSHSMRRRSYPAAVPHDCGFPLGHSATRGCMEAPSVAVLMTSGRLSSTQGLFTHQRVTGVLRCSL